MMKFAVRHVSREGDSKELLSQVIFDRRDNPHMRFVYRIISTC